MAVPTFASWSSQKRRLLSLRIGLKENQKERHHFGPLGSLKKRHTPKKNGTQGVNFRREAFIEWLKPYLTGMDCLPLKWYVQQFEAHELRKWASWDKPPTGACGLCPLLQGGSFGLQCFRGFPPPETLGEE